jgi:hypothetical protein
MTTIEFLEAGQRVSLVLTSGDTFDVDIARATHSGSVSIVDVVFEDGAEGLLWYVLGRPRVTRHGWRRPHDVADVVVVVPATDLEDEDEHTSFGEVA